MTGGGRGIGAAICRLAAKRGYDVCVNYRSDAAAAGAVVQDIQAKGRSALAVQADVSMEQDVVRLFQESDAGLGAMSLLVNNAGVLETQMRLDQMDGARIGRVLGANVVGTMLCAREAVRRMSTRYGGAGGSIVNLSSMAARLGAPGEYVDYAASKGAVDTITVGLAKEVAGEGIRVNAVRPGMIYTDIHADGGEPGRVDRLKTSIPLGRGGHPEEVAQAVMWLASSEASYVTGTFIDVSGGR